MMIGLSENVKSNEKAIRVPNGTVPCNGKHDKATIIKSTI